MGILTPVRKVKKYTRKKLLGTGRDFWKEKFNEYDDRKAERLCKPHMEKPLIDNLVFFESFLGRNVADSPYAMFLEMINNPDYAGYNYVWSVNNMTEHEKMACMPKVKVVKRKSPEYYEAILTAKYVINNITNDERVPKREGQIYVQTWHGTPLKRLGMDIELDGNGYRNREEIHAQYRREADKFDYLVSPSPYTTEKLGSAFGLTENEKKDKIIELGYPRNAWLYSCTDADRAQIKHEMGIPEDKKVVLYCTTWREQNYVRGQGFTFNVELDYDKIYEALKDTACIVMRMHYNHKQTEIDFDKYNGFLFNGTAVDEVNRLFVIADVLVTDYSSVMFDFANLRKPMVFYMYDRERYENEVRGFYFDPSELPGPVVTTQEELEKALKSVLSAPYVPDDKYKAFCDKFVCKDDKDAAKRTVEVLLPKKEA